MWFPSTELLVLLNPVEPFLSCVKDFLRTEEMRYTSIIYWHVAFFFISSYHFAGKKEQKDNSIRIIFHMHDAES